MALKTMVSLLMLLVASLLFGEDAVPKDSVGPRPESGPVQQAADIIRSGGNIDNLAARLNSLISTQESLANKRDISMLLAKLYVASGDFLAALATVKPFMNDPVAGLYAARLGLVCNDDTVIKAALLPLLADPAAASYAEARQLLGLQLFRAGNHAAVLESLGNNSDDLSLLLRYQSLKSLGQHAQARELVTSAIGSDNAAALLSKVARLEKNYEFDPVSLILFGMGELPGLLEAELAAENTDSPVAVSGTSVDKQAVTAHKVETGATIQVGFFSALENAKKLDAKLQALSFRSRILKEEKKQIRYKVVVDVPDGVDPQTILLSLKDKGIEGFLVR